MKQHRPRVDDHGRAFAGSQLQVQVYVSRRMTQLSEAVGMAIGVEPASITWVAPLEEQRFIEPMDGAFLDALQLGHLRSQLSEFWPRRGPSWDALAVVTGAGSPAAFILAEGNSYPAEILGPGCMAQTSRTTIEQAINRSKAYFGVDPQLDWMGELYQYANRLAHVHFLIESTGRPAWLVNLCFIDDVTRVPTGIEEWREELSRIKTRLGFAEAVPHNVDVFLPALRRGVLVEADSVTQGFA
jgi:hypothetical protein